MKAASIQKQASCLIPPRLFCCYARLLFPCQLFRWSFSLVVIVIQQKIVAAAAAKILVKVIVLEEVIVVVEMEVEMVMEEVEMEEVEEVEMEEVVEEVVVMEVVEVEEHAENFHGVISMEKIKISHVTSCCYA